MGYRRHRSVSGAYRGRFVRAPLDNDIGVSQADFPDPNARQVRWDKAGLWSMQRELESPDVDAQPAS